MDIQTLELSDDFSFLYTGPSLDQGPLPTLIYFALYAEDSLQTDPFNQPVQFLENVPIRIFSVTLPGHEAQLPPENAIQVWAKAMGEGQALIPSFVNQVKKGIDHLFQQDLIAEDKLAVAGLSRGAFIACHVAAVCLEVKTILGYAPVTRLSFAKEFSEIREENAVTALNLENLTPQLYNRKVRFYIGNCDVRVSTQHCFSFIQHLARTAKENRISSSPIELFIGPSIGFQGHGTAPEVFQKGVDWIKQELLP